MPSKQIIGVRLPGTAPRAASSMVERQALNLCLGRGSSPWRRTRCPLAQNGRAPDPGSGGSWFEARVGSRASVAHPAERSLRTGRKAVRGRPEAPCPASPMAGGTSLRRTVVPVRVRHWVSCRASSSGQSAEPVPPRQRVRDLHAALGGEWGNRHPAGLLKLEMRLRIALPQLVPS